MVRSLREPVSVIRFGPPAPPVNASSVSAKSLEPTSWWRVARGYGVSLAVGVWACFREAGPRMVKSAQDNGLSCSGGYHPLGLHWRCSDQEVRGL